MGNVTVAADSKPFIVVDEWGNRKSYKELKAATDAIIMRLRQQLEWAEKFACGSVPLIQDGIAVVNAVGCLAPYERFKVDVMVDLHTGARYRAVLVRRDG